MIPTYLKALRDLGPVSLGLFALYRVGLKSGYFEKRLPGHVQPTGQWEFQNPYSPPQADRIDALLGSERIHLLDEAEAILHGSFTAIGSAKLALNFRHPDPLRVWTAYQKTRIYGQDIKFTWEPARFGWGVTLARAFQLTGEDRYRAKFYKTLNQFVKENPAYQGPHWANGQEVALRLLHLVFCFWVFGDADSALIATHAARIPPTLIYARAQNNNHLLSEAAALYTASQFIPSHPQAKKWRDLGWHWLNTGFQRQIDRDGTYIQHSTNYHRLVLQLALWVNLLASREGRIWPRETLEKLNAASRWLHRCCDTDSGRVPNLGHHDGANILALTACPAADFRPVVQTACQVFSGEKPFEPGPWDEMGLWLIPPGQTDQRGPAAGGPAIRADLAQHAQSLRRLIHPNLTAHGFLRAARYSGRPGHADQLHVDLWWQGENIARDAGTYLYNADPPWDNGLMPARVHNTVTLQNRDQMSRASRFLYLDKAQGRFLENTEHQLRATHDGYRKLGVYHTRTLSATGDGWRVLDEIETMEGHEPRDLSPIRIQWLLPDWNWELQGSTLRIQSQQGWIVIAVTSEPFLSGVVSLVRGGKQLRGEGRVEPVDGWYSPNYGVKLPGLSFSVTYFTQSPFSIRTDWQFTTRPQPGVEYNSG